MGHYKSNLRDLEFNLFELFGLDESLSGDNFGDLDGEAARDMLREVVRLSEGPLAKSFADADRNPPVFDPETHTLKLPDSFKKSFKALYDGEWWRVGLDEEVGGIPAPRSLGWAINEMLLGAQPAAFMYSAGPSFANVLYHNGTEQQKEWAKIIVERQWGATMVLTEPDAGSDVGAGRTKAIKQEDGTWHIEGVKRFITSAEHDMSENIMHLVLARPVGVEGAGGPGTKGLSLFLLPKYHFDHETGELTGERNGVYVTNVEHKMGIKVSNTCEVTFGEKEPAKGWLLGEVHNGIAQMFQVIENARMMVGTKAIATLSTGYLNALEFAKSRQQGADLTQSGDKTAPRVAITAHPDVRRSLMVQKSFSEAMRALVFYTASWQDKIMVAEHEGTMDAEETKLAEAVNDLLLPIVKGYGSERSWVLLGTESLQTFGGSGFLQEYPIEQYVRDAKIDTLYEGTTAIQGQDFFFRKIVKDQGKALGHLAGEIQSFIDSEAGNGRLKNERALLATALDDANAMVGHLINDLMSAQEEIRNIYKVGLNTSRLLMTLGDVVCAWLLLRGAEVALEKLGGPEGGGKDKAFYEGKVAAAQFFAQNVLPKIAAERAIAEATDLSLMDIDEAAF